MALQLYGTRLEGLSGRHDDAAAALLRALVDGFLNGMLVLGSRGRWLGAELGDEVVLAAGLRGLDALLNLSVELFVPLLGLGTEHGQQQSEQK